MLLIGGADDTPVEKEYSLLVMPEKLVIPYPNQELPTIVEQACEAIIAHAGVVRKYEFLSYFKNAREDTGGGVVAPNPPRIS